MNPDRILINDILCFRLSSLFPPYKVTRARAWFKNYAPDELLISEGQEWVTEWGYQECSADIDRDNPNVIQLDVVYERILASHGKESADAFRDELLRMRGRRK